MIGYFTRHSLAIFAISSALFGFGMGANGIYQIAQDESHHVERITS